MTLGAQPRGKPHQQTRKAKRFMVHCDTQAESEMDGRREEPWGGERGLKFPAASSAVPGARHTDHCDLIVPTGGEVKECPDYIRNRPGQGTPSKSKE